MKRPYLGDNVGTKFHNDASSSLSTNGDIKVNTRKRPVYRQRSKSKGEIQRGGARYKTTRTNRDRTQRIPSLSTTMDLLESLLRSSVSTNTVISHINANSGDQARLTWFLGVFNSIESNELCRSKRKVMESAKGLSKRISKKSQDQNPPVGVGG